MKTKFVQLYILVVSLYAGMAFGVPWEPPTDTEIAMLPAYCASKFKNLPDSRHWAQVLGPSFGDVHHYCDALVQINRYYRSSNAEDRKFFLKSAISNIKYMFSHALPTQPRNVLLPEMHFTMGKVLILAGRDSEAAGEFLQAIQLKPGYAAPYAALADFYSSIGKKKDALKILEEGLRQVPASRSLARRYKKLGGKNLLPVPSPPAASATPAEEKTMGVKTDENVPVQPAVSIPTSASEGAATPVATQPAPTAKDSPKIGTPTNPYCRFCP